MIERMEEVARVPAPASMHVGEGVPEYLLQHLPRSASGNPEWFGSTAFTGIPVIRNADLAPGEWVIKDQYGETMKSGRFSIEA